MFSQFLAAGAAVSLIGAGVAGATATRSFDALPGIQTAVADGEGGGARDKCRVDVIRAGTPGSATVTRQVMVDGSCVCSITTGPANSNGSAENAVTMLLRDRTCADAPTVGDQVSDAARSGGGRGGNAGLIIPVLVGVVGAAGLAVALGSSSNG